MGGATFERPALVAHGAGNQRTALRAAIAAQVDWIEADLWLARGSVVARHEKAVWRLPLLYDMWTVRLAEWPPLCLPELCQVTAGGPRLLLDLKGSNAALVPAVIDALRSGNAIHRAAVCGQNWRLLDTAYSAEPRLQVFYSMETARHLAGLRTRPAGCPPISAASVSDSLLSPEFLDELHERGILTLAWTVNSTARARELPGLVREERESRVMAQWPRSWK